MSSGVRVDDASRPRMCVMETTTVETMLMNRTAEVPPPHHQVHYTVTISTIFDEFTHEETETVPTSA